jgi:hypothetical protein
MIEFDDVYIPGLLREVEGCFTLDAKSVHGPGHSKAVLANGMKSADALGGDIRARKPISAVWRSGVCAMNSPRRFQSKPYSSTGRANLGLARYRDLILSIPVAKRSEGVGFQMREFPHYAASYPGGLLT